MRDIKVGAGGPDLEVICQRRNPDTGVITAENISSMASAAIRITDDKGNHLDDLTATHTTDGTDGSLTATWTTAVTAAPNDLRLEARVTIGGQLRIYPERGYGKARVNAALPAS